MGRPATGTPEPPTATTTNRRRRHYTTPPLLLTLATTLLVDTAAAATAPLILSADIQCCAACQATITGKRLPSAESWAVSTGKGCVASPSSSPPTTLLRLELENTPDGDEEFILSADLPGWNATDVLKHQHAADNRDRGTLPLCYLPRGATAWRAAGKRIEIYPYTLVEWDTTSELSVPPPEGEGGGTATAAAGGCFGFRRKTLLSGSSVVVRAGATLHLPSTSRTPMSRLAVHSGGAVAQQPGASRVTVETLILGGGGSATPTTPTGVSISGNKTFLEATSIEVLPGTAVTLRGTASLRRHYRVDHESMLFRLRSGASVARAAHPLWGDPPKGLDPTTLDGGFGGFLGSDVHPGILIDFESSQGNATLVVEGGGSTAPPAATPACGGAATATATRVMGIAAASHTVVTTGGHAAIFSLRTTSLRITQGSTLLIADLSRRGPTGIDIGRGGTLRLDASLAARQAGISLPQPGGRVAHLGRMAADALSIAGEGSLLLCGAVSIAQQPVKSCLLGAGSTIIDGAEVSIPPTLCFGLAQAGGGPRTLLALRGGGSFSPRGRSAEAEVILRAETEWDATAFSLNGTRLRAAAPLTVSTPELSVADAVARLAEGSKLQRGLITSLVKTTISSPVPACGGGNVGLLPVGISAESPAPGERGTVAVPPANTVWLSGCVLLGDAAFTATPRVSLRGMTEESGLVTAGYVGFDNAQQPGTPGDIQLRSLDVLQNSTLSLNQPWNKVSASIAEVRVSGRLTACTQATLRGDVSVSSGGIITAVTNRVPGYHHSLSWNGSVTLSPGGHLEVSVRFDKVYPVLLRGSGPMQFDEGVSLSAEYTPHPPPPQVGGAAPRYAIASVGAASIGAGGSFASVPLRLASSALQHPELFIGHLWVGGPASFTQPGFAICSGGSGLLLASGDATFGDGSSLANGSLGVAGSLFLKGGSEVSTGPNGSVGVTGPAEVLRGAVLSLGSPSLFGSSLEISGGVRVAAQHAPNATLRTAGTLTIRSGGYLECASPPSGAAGLDFAASPEAGCATPLLSFARLAAPPHSIRGCGPVGAFAGSLYSTSGGGGGPPYIAALSGCAICLLVAVAAATPLASGGRAARGALRGLLRAPPVRLRLLPAEVILSTANCAAAGGIALEAAWFVALAAHPAARILPVAPTAAGIRGFEAAVFLGSLQGVPYTATLLSVAAVLLIWGMAWIRVRRFASGVRDINLAVRGVGRGARHAWDAASVQIVHDSLRGTSRRMHTALSAAGSALLVPILLILFAPLQCSGSGSTLRISPNTPGGCYGSPFPLVFVLPLGCCCAAALAFLVVDSASHTAIPLRHPPFVPAMDLRSKRGFDAIRVVAVALQVFAVSALRGGNPKVLFGASAGIQACYLLATLVVVPSVYDNVNRARASAQTVGVWSAVLAVATPEGVATNICDVTAPAAPPGYLVGVWFAGAVVCVGVLWGAWRWIRPDAADAEAQEAVEEKQRAMQRLRATYGGGGGEWGDDEGDDADTAGLVSGPVTLEEVQRHVREFRRLHDRVAMPYYLALPAAGPGDGEQQTELSEVPPLSPDSTGESGVAPPSPSILDGGPAPPVPSAASSSSAGAVSAVSGEEGYHGWTRGKLLGRGTYGKVYVAVLRTGALVAVKVIDLVEGLPEDDEQVVKVRREVGLMKRLQHPNVIQYKACVTERRRLNIFMEYAVGGSLASLAKSCSSRLSEALAAKYIKQMLEGLAFLHSNGVIHRDIKGDNVLMDGNGCVKLADFGCARNVTTATFAGTFTGTPYWMAPEVLQQKFEACGYNKKADIWSVGCTAIELLTRGSLPWRQDFESVWAAIYHVANNKEHPTNKPTDVTPECSAFFDVCFERDPRDRPEAEALLRCTWLQLSADDTLPVAENSDSGQAQAGSAASRDHLSLDRDLCVTLDSSFPIQSDWERESREPSQEIPSQPEDTVDVALPQMRIVGTASSDDDLFGTM